MAKFGRQKRALQDKGTCYAYSKRSQVRAIKTIHAFIPPSTADANAKFESRILNFKQEGPCTTASMPQLGTPLPELSLSNVGSKMNSPRAMNDHPSNKLLPGANHNKFKRKELTQELSTIGPAFVREPVYASSREHTQKVHPIIHSISNDGTCFVDRETGLNYPTGRAFKSLSGTGRDADGMIEEGSIESIDEAPGIHLLNPITINQGKKSGIFDVPWMELCSKCELELLLPGANPFKAKEKTEIQLENVTLDTNIDWVCAVGTKKEECSSKTFSLRLDYEDVLSAWSDRGSLWLNGWKLRTVPDDSVFDWDARLVPGTKSQSGSDIELVPQTSSQADGDIRATEVRCMDGSKGETSARQARVRRYMEKRSTRLFSNKIRYEVRKLNAERRPRMKGRFVRRSSLSDGAQMEQRKASLRISSCLE